MSSLHKYHKSCSELIWPFYGLLQVYEVRLQKSYIFVSSVHKYHKSCFQLIWPFYGLLQLYEVKLQKFHISVSSVHKYHKSCSELIWPFYDLLQLYNCMTQNTKLLHWTHGDMRLLKSQLYDQKSHISGSSVHKYHNSCSRAHLTVLRLITTVWGKTSKISFLCEFSAQVSQMLFWSSFDRFTAYYNNYEEKLQ